MYSTPPQPPPEARAHQTQPFPGPLSRTLSSASISSGDEDASMSSSTITAIGGSTRRTRKRFTNVQLTMLENLFHQNSHPSREDRESVARAGGMEIKSVTIWFQNKRQTERKTAQAGHPDHTHSPNVVPNITSTLHTFSLHNAHHSVSRTSSSTASSSPPFSVASSRSGSVLSASGAGTNNNSNNASRPSLDRVASRSEIRASAPRTPSRRPSAPGSDPRAVGASGGAIWDNMPSSPLAPPISPPAREFIDFSRGPKQRRTLEWACAAARVADKDGYASGLSGATAAASSPMAVSMLTSQGQGSSASGSGSRSPGKGRTVRQHDGGGVPYYAPAPADDPRYRPRPRREDSSSGMEIEVTDDEEDEEAITPPSTWGKDDRRWRAGGEEGAPSLMAMTNATVTGVLPKGADDDMFKAAIALCGLGRRTG